MEPNLRYFRKKINRISYCLPYSKAVTSFSAFIFQHSNAVCEYAAQKGVTSPGKRLKKLNFRNRNKTMFRCCFRLCSWEVRWYGNHWPQALLEESHYIYAAGSEISLVDWSRIGTSFSTGIGSLHKLVESLTVPFLNTVPKTWQLSLCSVGLHWQGVRI